MQKKKMRQLTGFLHFLQSSGSGQSELLWPSWRQLKHRSGSGQSSWFVQAHPPDRHQILIPSRAPPSDSGGTPRVQGSPMPCAPETHMLNVHHLNKSHLLTTVSALVIPTSSTTTTSWTVPWVKLVDSLTPSGSLKKL